MPTTAVTSSTTDQEMRGQKLYTWTGVGTGGATLGDPVSSQGRQAMVHVSLTANLNGQTVTFEGSNDGTTYSTLKDANGNALSFTADALVLLFMIPIYVRPKITGAASGAGVKVSLLTQSIV